MKISLETRFWKKKKRKKEKRNSYCSYSFRIPRWFLLLQLIKVLVMENKVKVFTFLQWFNIIIEENPIAKSLFYHINNNNMYPYIVCLLTNPEILTLKNIFFEGLILKKLLCHILEKITVNIHVFYYFISLLMKFL